MRCTYCGSSQHTQALCPKTYGGSAARLNLWCSYCGSREHDIQACPRTWAGSGARAYHQDTVEDHFRKD